METRHLRIFTAVYRTRSFTKAAEILYTSQPTVSEHMRNLEERLGCKLFDRLGRSIMPTPEAELLFPRAMELLDEMKKIEETLARAVHHVSGELIIGASTIPGAYLLPDYATAFKNNYPDVSFEVKIGDSAEIVKTILNHELYLGVVGARTSSSKLEYTPLVEDTLVLAAAASKNIPAEIEPEHLLRFDFLLREQGSGTGKTIAGYLDQYNINPAQLKVRAILGSSTAIKEAVKSNLGISIISKRAIRDELADGRIKEIKIKNLQMKRSFYMVSIKKRTMPNHYLVFANFLKNSASASCEESVTPEKDIV